MRRKFTESELIINADGVCSNSHLRSEQLADYLVR